MVPQPQMLYAPRHLSVIARTFLCKQLLTEKFVALKKITTKDALKETNLYKCLLGENNCTNDI